MIDELPAREWVSVSEVFLVLVVYTSGCTILMFPVISILRCQLSCYMVRMGTSVLAAVSVSMLDMYRIARHEVGKPL